jgi:hypothetical protein
MVLPLDVTLPAAQELVARPPMESVSASATQRKGTIRRIDGFLLMFFTSRLFVYKISFSDEKNLPYGLSFTRIKRFRSDNAFYIAACFFGLSEMQTRI